MRWLFAVLFGIAIAVRLNQTVNNDVAWYLHAAGAWFDGGQLYRDIFFEVNPPLALYLTTPAVYVARLTGLFPVHVYFVYVFAVIALSLALFAHVLDRSSRASPSQRRGLTLAAFLALAIAPAGDFGQREHFTMILILPYVTLLAQRVMGRACGRPLAATVGVSAALGFAIKPYFLVPWLAVELYVIARRRSPAAAFRPETVALAVTGLLYGASLVLVTPDYLTSVVPYALEVYNGNYRNPLELVLMRKETALVPLTALLFLLVRRQLDLREFGDVFLISALGFFTVYVVQMKGWNYQIYPVTAWLIMSYAALVAGAPAGKRNAAAVRDGGRRSLLTLAGLVMIGMVLLKPAVAAGNFYPLTNYLRPFVEKYASGQSIYFFSSNTWTGFPLVTYSKVGWASRFPALWLLPGLVNQRDSAPDTMSAERRAMMARIERFVKRAVVDDLIRFLPALIMVDNRPRKQWYAEAGFDFIEFFSADACFRALWSRYEEIDNHNGWQVFRLRKTGSHGPLPCRSTASQAAKY